MKKLKIRFHYYIITLFLLLCVNSIAAQSFVSLNWDLPEPFYIGTERLQLDFPSFKDASYRTDSHLPYYVQQLKLGTAYSLFSYQATVEYPELEALSTKESVALQRALNRESIALEAFPKVITHVGASAKQGVLDIAFLPYVLRDGQIFKLLSFKLRVENPIKSFRALAKSSAATPKYATSSVLSTGKWVQIKVEEDGIYKLTTAQLSKMGFNSPERVRLFGYGGHQLYEDFAKNKIDDLQEVPLWRSSSSLLFYANGTIRWDVTEEGYVHTQNHFSTYGSYFLTEGDSPLSFPKVSSITATASTVEQTTYPDYALYEKDEFAWYEGGRRLFEAYDYKNGLKKSYTFSQLEGITNTPGSITVASTAHSSGGTNVSVTIDDNMVGSFMIAPSYSVYDLAKAAEMTKEWVPTAGQSTSTVVIENAQSNNAHLDYIRLNFTRKLALYGNATRFRGTSSGVEKYVISNADQNTVVWDVTDAANYFQVDGTLTNQQYVFVADNTLPREYVVFNQQAVYPSVEVMGTIENQNLHALRNLDMVIITPPNADLFQEAERLAAAHREKDGMTVQVVTSNQIYNEFSSGTPDATAYRLFMKMLYDEATTEAEQPRYLLLFGDAVFDNRLLTPAMYRKKQSDYLLCYEGENSFSDTDCYVLDDYYGYLDDGEGIYLTRDKVDIGVGRLPVHTAQEAKDVVDKLLAYMSNEHAGAWKNTVCFAADDGLENEENSHMQQADALAKVVAQNNASIKLDKVYWDAFKVTKTATGNAYPDVRKRLLELFDEGILLFDYAGHGGPTVLSHENVLKIEDVAALSSEKPALWVTASCKITPFDGLPENMGEVAMLNPKGGAIGLFTTTRTVYTDRNALMNSTFIKNVFTKGEDNKPLRFGDAVRITKAAMSTYGYVNNLQFVFLGDPAMRFSYPSYEVVVDQFNTAPAEETATTIKAGGNVTVKGRVLDEMGNPATSFNGEVYATVQDNLETITTYNNTGFASYPFSYQDRTKMLFTGSNVVTDGNFSFNFPVPLDINYSNENGMINLYAIDAEKEHEGNGTFSNFLIGGTETGATASDGVGPTMTVYLNTPDFVYGDKVNQTPYLFVELEDADGINTVGNGVGHDIVAILDNSPVYYYELNSYYESVLGDYTKGTIRYQLPSIAPGKHELLVRAWDVKNNSSFKKISFNVVEGLSLGSLDILCDTSPAVSGTTFILSHDRPGELLNVKISVCDLSGNDLWTYTTSGTSSGNYYYVDWNLETSGGQRVAPGLYLFCATVSTNDSSEITRTRKIVVAAQ